MTQQRSPLIGTRSIDYIPEAERHGSLYNFYSGPMVTQLGGVDISWIVGVVVPGVLYYWLARTSAVTVGLEQQSKA